MTQHNDIGRTGQNLSETVLTPASVSSGNFGKLYAIPLDGQAYAQPLYLSSLQIGGLSHSVLFVATQHDSVYALDANAGGAKLWHASLLDALHGAAAGAIPMPEAQTNCNDVQGPEYGIVGTPVIDAATGTLYVVSLTYEGTYPVQRLHALDVTNGAEKFGGPVVIQATIAGTGTGSSGGLLSFDPKWEVQRPGLLLVNGTVYIAWGAFCDAGPWHGWVMGYTAASGALLQTSSFVTSPNGSSGGIWTSGAGLSADNIAGKPRMFPVTGNGTFDALQDWGDSVLNLDLNGALKVTDSFTPYNQSYLSDNDLDLGTGSLLVLPDQPGAHPHLGVVIGKQGELYLLDRDNLGGNGASSDSVVQEFNIATAGYGFWGVPAYFNGSIYFWPFDGSLQQYSLSNGLLSTSAAHMGQQSEAGSKLYFFGSTPSVSANGITQGIVWVDDWIGYTLAPDQLFYAYDASDVSKTLWSSSTNSARDDAGPAQKFAVPTIADGKVFLASQNQIVVYGLLAPSYSPTVLFGSVTVGAASTKTLNFAESTAGATVTSLQVLTEGVAGGDFALASGSTCSAASATPCTLNVAFTPQTSGLRKGAVVITDSSGRITTIFISGIGLQTPSFVSGIQSTFVSGLDHPAGVAVDGAGNVYIANKGPGSVTEVSPTGAVVKTITGLAAPCCLALDGAGNLYISEIGNSDVVKLLPGATTFSVFATGFNSGNSPQGSATDGAGNVYVSDTNNGLVTKISPAGIVTPIGTGAVTLLHPSGVAINAAGDLFISDTGSGKIVEVPASGAANTVILAGGFLNPSSIAVDSGGNLFVTDSTAGVLYELPAGATTPLQVGSGFNQPIAATVRANGDLYVADQLSGSVVKIQRSAASSGQSQTILFGAIASQTVNSTLALTATASSGFTVSYASSTPAVCTVAGVTASFVSAGSCTIAASQAGNNIYAAAAPVSQTFTVLVAETITFTNPGTQTIANSLTLSGVASSNLAVSYSSSTSAVCTVSAGVASFLAAGTCTITASQSGNSTYAPAAAVSQSFTVVAGKPNISGVTVTLITSNSATVTWTTDQATTSLVNYGTTSAYGYASVLATALVSTHSVTLTGLAAAQTLNFDVVSANSAGTSATSANATFSTLASSAIPPYVGYVAAWGINDSSATVTWSTDVLANTVLAYGVTSALGQLSPLQTALAASHGVVLSGLNSGTTYYFVAQSTATNGATGYSAVLTFTTTGTPKTATKPPVISLVAAAGMTSNSVTITWSTDQAATSQVNYGTTATYTSSSALNSALVTDHSVTLSNLTAATTYNFDVVSANASGSPATSTNYTFTTVSAGVPVITNVAAGGLAGTSATITWTTDQATSSQVNYGTTGAYGSSSPLVSTLVTTHSVALPNLSPGTTYSFSVASVNASGLAANSPNATFLTPSSSAIPPSVGYVAAWGINDSNATVTWSTDVPADTSLAYGTTPALGQVTPIQTLMAASHGVVLTGLNSGTTYYFVAQSTGANGATGYSTTLSFTTTGFPTTPAPLISSVASVNITTTSATITWTTDQPSTSQVNYGATTAYGLSSTANPALVTSHSVTLMGLSVGSAYNFDIVSANSAGKSSTSPNATFSTSAGTPVISALAVSAITGTSATVTWTTNQPATSLVNYGTTTAYGSASTLITTLSASHSVTLTNLTAGTTYNFDVASTNATNLTATAPNAMFSTVAGIPIISAVAVSAITGTSATITWTTDQPTTSLVNYGNTAAYGSASTLITTLSATHSVTLTNLTTGTTYNFAVVSTNAANTTATSPNATFSTVVGTPIISAVSVSAITGTSVTITWTTDQPTTSLVNYGLAATYGSSSTLITTLSATHSVTLNNLTTGATYNFAVVSTNAANLTATSPNATFATVAGTPVISAVSVSAITGTSATITWTTDQPTTSLVNYGPTPTYGSASTLTTTLSATHSVKLTNLTAGTTYNFAAVSTNATNLTATSPNSTFSTVVGTPIISAVSVSAITGTSATITWTTDQPTTSLVNYGATATYGSSSTLITTLSVSHSVTLSNLTAGITYNFDVVSTNATNLTATSPNSTFSTVVGTPIISVVSVSAITGTSATITWTTDQPTTSLVNYGATATYGSSSTPITTLSATHSVTLTNLTAGTTYNFDVVSTNATNLTATSPNGTFATVAGTPLISAVSVSAITGTSATITWTTDQPTTSLVNYGATATYGSSSTLITTLSVSHSVTLTNLTTGTTYNFAAVSTNATSLTATSPNTTFSTAPGGTAPQVQYVAYWGVTASGASISWSTDVPATTALSYGTTTTPNQVTPVQSNLTTPHGVTLTNLSPGTTYYFLAQSTGANGATGYSTTYSFTTLSAQVGPVISGITVVPGTGNQTQISWTTSLPANSYVQFGSTTAYNRWSMLTDVVTNPHPAMGYVPSGTIHYQLVSTDSRGYQTFSPDYVFVEP